MTSLATNCELTEDLELNLLDDGKALTVEYIGAGHYWLCAKLGPFTCQEEVKLRVTLVTPHPGVKNWRDTLLALASADIPVEEVGKVLGKVSWGKEDPNVHAYGVYSGCS